MVDLHLHSTASDGTLSPEELVKLASKLQFKAIALTDHDSAEGVAPALKKAQEYPGLEVIPAVELSSDVQGRDIHFLGYFIDYQSPWLKKHLKGLREARLKRAVKMVERLQKMGFSLFFKEVLAEAGSGAVGRPHIARAMLKKGYIHHIQEAFSRYIGRQAPAYVEKYAYTPEDVIKIIRKIGGISVLAHPGLTKVDELIPKFIKAGLKGLEVVHSDHSPEQIGHYRRLAERLGLVVTGGSDCHGLGSGRGQLLGSVKIPDSILENLKKLQQSF